MLSQFTSQWDAEALEFGPFRLMPATRTLFRGKQRVDLGCRAGAILVELVKNAGELVTNAKLLTHVWPAAKVTSGTLRVHIASLRKTLNEFARDDDFIHTVHGHGYRFVAPVKRLQSTRDASKLLPAILCQLQENERLLTSTRNHVLTLLASLDPTDPC